MRCPPASAALFAAAVLAPGGLPAWADPPAAISIILDDGVRQAAPGSESTYTLRVSNRGDTALEGITLAQTLPPSLFFVSADAGGRAQDGTVSWTVDVPAGRETVVHLSARVGDPTADEVPNLATTACARRGDGGPVLVCATDIDTMVIQEERSPRWLLPLSLVVGGALVGIVFLIRRRRRHRHSRET
ncbi:hypothetical protein [Streptosporangium sp. NPDC051022]|uniref:hypothetical protein n=1 Tax=Streptosporangium sp. NPDC051022 TaxID=3155752 RepID=UPI00344566C0